MSPSKRGKVTDVTIRLRRKDGRKVNPDEAKAAVWAAHKIAQRGGNLLAELREWHIEAIDWHNVYPSGRDKTYTYEGQDVADAIAAMGGILEKLGLAGLTVKPTRLRVGRVDRTGER